MSAALYIPLESLAHDGLPKESSNWRWRIINDGVMGGLSQGKYRTSEEGTGVFEGTLSLENRGGFSWVRTAKGDPQFAESEGIRLMVRGDGRTYGLTLDTSDQYNAFSYNHYFVTEKDRWQEIRIPYTEFRAQWFGRKMPMMRITKPGKIRDVGFIISDKKKGPFRLEIGSIGTY